MKKLGGGDAKGACNAEPETRVPGRAPSVSLPGLSLWAPAPRSFNAVTRKPVAFVQWPRSARKDRRPEPPRSGCDAPGDQEHTPSRPRSLTCSPDTGTDAAEGPSGRRLSWRTLHSRPPGQLGPSGSGSAARPLLSPPTPCLPLRPGPCGDQTGTARPWLPRPSGTGHAGYVPRLAPGPCTAQGVPCWAWSPAPGLRRLAVTFLGAEAYQGLAPSKSPPKSRVSLCRQLKATASPVASPTSGGGASTAPGASGERDAPAPGPPP